MIIKKNCTFLPFYLPDRICNSPFCQSYNFYNVSSENLVLDQVIIPKLIFFFILVTYLVDIVVILYGKILSWSLMGVKGLTLLVQILNYFHYLCLLEIKCTDKLSTLRMFTCFEHIIVIISLVITKYFYIFTGQSVVQA